MKQCMDADNLHRRLKKIIGQVQAIDRMVDEDVPCEDIITQVNAANRRFTRWGRSFWRATCSTASGMASSREMRKKP